MYIISVNNNDVFRAGLKTEKYLWNISVLLHVGGNMHTARMELTMVRNMFDAGWAAQ
jgi:hypothetical protein